MIQLRLGSFGLRSRTLMARRPAITDLPAAVFLARSGSGETAATHVQWHRQIHSRKAGVAAMSIASATSGYRARSWTAGESFEWDVQLSQTGRYQLGWLSRDGAYVNRRGQVRHR